MSHTSSRSEALERGGDVLKRHPNFRLVGRDQELVDLTSILMRMRKHNIVITGRGGVGVSSIVLGIQASKSDHRTPIEIVGKRFFWLHTDRVFESGNPSVISELFERIRQTLARNSQSVLVVEDIVDFLKASQACGCSHLTNGLMGDLKSGRYQAILETSDESLGEILRCDGDLLEFCTMYEVREPSGENLRLILNAAREGLEQHHGVDISASAIETAAKLTEKYRLSSLRAQPDAALSLLDQALTDFCRSAHLQPREILLLDMRRQELEHALSGSELKEELSHVSAEEISELLLQVEVDRLAAVNRWEERQREIRSLYRDMSDGEEEIRRLEDSIARVKLEQAERARDVGSHATTAEVESGKAGHLASLMNKAQMDTSEVLGIKSRIAQLEKLVAAAAQRYRELVSEVYAGLEIDEGHVLKSFSVISGIPVDKLSEDDRERLRGLESTLLGKVVGQPQPTVEVARAVKRSRLGLKLPNRPSGSFMFLGPSGVGKTELAKVLAEALGVPLLRFDMSEYMEKHAVAKLIGAPPGYEGYEQGGILTNSVRKNPYSVVLFDEIEKAHPDAFNLMLQLLDDARLTDSRGLTASFSDCVIIMTTNIGTRHFLDEGIDFTEASELALGELRQEYRPEFLGRFGGCIYCFRRLELEVQKAIARRDLDRIEKLIEQHGLHLQISDKELEELVRLSYVAREGARSILGFIDRSITSGLAELLLEGMPRSKQHTSEDASQARRDTVEVLIDPGSKEVSLQFV